MNDRHKLEQFTLGAEYSSEWLLTTSCWRIRKGSWGFKKDNLWRSNFIWCKSLYKWVFWRSEDRWTLQNRTPQNWCYM